MGQRIVCSVKMITTVNDHNIATTQTPGAAGNLTLAGTAVSGGVATLVSSGAALVTITSAGDDHTKTFTIYGTDESGIPQSEGLAGANIGVATSTLYYQTVTRIAVSAATAGAVTAGMSGVGVTRWVNFNIHAQPTNISVGYDTTGTVNYTAQYTYDDPSSVTKIWTDSRVSAATGDLDTTYNDPVAAIRVLLNSGSGTVAMTAIQAGIVGA